MIMTRTRTQRAKSRSRQPPPPPQALPPTKLSAAELVWAIPGFIQNTLSHLSLKEGIELLTLSRDIFEKAVAAVLTDMTDERHRKLNVVVTSTARRTLYRSAVRTFSFQPTMLGTRIPSRQRQTPMQFFDLLAVYPNLTRINLVGVAHYLDCTRAAEEEPFLVHYFERLHSHTDVVLEAPPLDYLIYHLSFDHFLPRSIVRHTQFGLKLQLCDPSINNPDLLANDITLLKRRKMFTDSHQTLDQLTVQDVCSLLAWAAFFSPCRYSVSGEVEEEEEGKEIEHILQTPSHLWLTVSDINLTTLTKLVGRLAAYGTCLSLQLTMGDYWWSGNLRIMELFNAPSGFWHSLKGVKILRLPVELASGTYLEEIPPLDLTKARPLCLPLKLQHLHLEIHDSRNYAAEWPIPRMGDIASGLIAIAGVICKITVELCGFLYDGDRGRFLAETMQNMLLAEIEVSRRAAIGPVGWRKLGEEERI